MSKSKKISSRTRPQISALGLRIKTEVKEALDAAAADDERSVNQFAERILAAYLKNKGYLP